MNLLKGEHPDFAKSPQAKSLGLCLYSRTLLVVRQANFAGKTRENKNFFLTLLPLLPLLPLPALTRQFWLVRVLGCWVKLFVQNWDAPTIIDCVKIDHEIINQVKC